MTDNSARRASRARSKGGRLGPRLVFILLVVLTLLSALAALAVLMLSPKAPPPVAIKDIASNASNLGTVVEEDFTDDKGHDTFAIEYNGERYAYNDDVTAVLLLGIDRADHDELDYLNGQCDAIAVVAMDNRKKTATVINIPRDSMGYVSRRLPGGHFEDQYFAQLAIAHSFGVDDKDSVELAQRSITNFLYGVPIYQTVQFKVLGVPKANDLVVGVTVTLLEDFTNLSFAPNRSDPAMKKGETLTLTGKQAYTYVQYRDIHQPDSSLQRLQRQVQYAKAYFNKLKSVVKQNPMFIATAVTELKEYLYTNIPINELINLANQALAINLDEVPIKTVEGTLKEGERFMEYYVDEAKLKELVLEVFYEKL